MTKVTNLQFTNFTSGTNQQFIVVDNLVTRRLRFSDLFTFLRQNITGANQDLNTASTVGFAGISIRSTGTFSNLLVRESVQVGGAYNTTSTQFSLVLGNNFPTIRNDTSILFRGYSDRYDNINSNTNYPIIVAEKANRSPEDPFPVNSGDKLLSIGVGGWAGRDFTFNRTGNLTGHITFQAAENWGDNAGAVLQSGTEFYLGTHPIRTLLPNNSYLSHIHMKQYWELEQSSPTPVVMFGSGLAGIKNLVRDSGENLIHEGVSKLRFLNSRVMIDGVPAENTNNPDNSTLPGSNTLTIISNRRSATNDRRMPILRGDSIGHIVFRGQYINTATINQLGTNSGGISYFAIDNYTTSTAGSKVTITTISTGTTLLSTRLDLHDREHTYQSDRHVFKDNSGTTIAILTTSSATFYSATINLPSGSGSGSGVGLSSRQNVASTSSLLTVGSTASLTVTGFKTYVLSKVETNVPAWVRIYTNSVGQTTDVTRAQYLDPPASRGVVAEVVTTSGSLTTKIAPAIIGYNDQPTVNNSIFLNVTNQHSAASTVTVTLTLLQLET